MKLKSLYLVLAAASLALVTACGPAKVEPLVEIGPNETAFLIPLEGANKANQKAFMSIGYLNENKVATKRVVIPVRKRDTGRGPGDFEYIATMKVITVKRAPETREWTKTPGTGTSASDQAIEVESAESINFGCGINMTATITEEDAATFLYWYSGKPLAEVMDTNVRGYVQNHLSAAFGAMKIDDVRKKKTEVFMSMAEATKAEFKTKGITITNIGNTGGLSYAKPEIQAAIDSAYIAERKLEQANVEKLTAVATAQGIADARVVAAKGEAQANKLLNDSLTPNVLRQQALKAWNGELPQVTSGATPFVQLH